MQKDKRQKTSYLMRNLLRKHQMLFKSLGEKQKEVSWETLLLNIQVDQNMKDKFLIAKRKELGHLSGMMVNHTLVAI